MRNGLNILCVGTLPPHPGGSAISCSQILVGLARLGHTVRALAPITPDALPDGDRFAARYPEIHVTRFVVPRFDIAPPIPSPAEYRELERARIQERLSALIAAHRPDVVLIGRETFVWDVPEIAEAHRVPSIMLIRGGSRTTRFLNGAYPDVIARELLAKYRKVDLLVTVAKHLTEGLQRLGFKAVRTNTNAVDLRQFSPRPKDIGLLRTLGLREDNVVVMHVANLQARKRSLDLVSSAELALKRDRRLVYIMVGDGPLRQVMEESCKRKRIYKQFRYIGWVEYDLVPEYMNLADIVVMPSESEGLARVYLEAQACGRLLLASEIPAAREVVVNGENGLLFRLSDIEELTAKTLLAAEDSGLRANIGRNARESVQAYSLEDAVAAYAVACEEVIQRHRQDL